MTEKNVSKIEILINKLLIEIGEDPNREGLVKTPERVAKAWEFLAKGYKQELSTVINDAVFTEEYDEMVTVKDVDFFSLCEHHLLPFFGKAHVAYIPDGKIIGLSKIPRIIEMYGRRLQVQERMTQQIATAMDELIQPNGIGVVVEAQHLCTAMRGVRKPNTTMTTSAVRGLFKKNPSTREEFFSHVRQS